MVLGLNPMGKPTIWIRKLFFGQNQGIAWSSDSSLWEANYLDEKTRFWTEPRHCMVLGLRPMGKPTTWMRKLGFG